MIPLAVCGMLGVSNRELRVPPAARLIARSGFGFRPGFSFVSLLAIFLSRRVELLPGVTFLLFELAQSWFVFFFL